MLSNFIAEKNFSDSFGLINSPTGVGSTANADSQRVGAKFFSAFKFKGMGILRRKILVDPNAIEKKEKHMYSLILFSRW
jgi:hypothetical protein